MGRFDALTKLEEKTEQTAQNVAVKTPTSTNSDSEEKSTKKPANPQDSKTSFGQNHLPANLHVLTEIDKPEKYTTRLEPEMIKKIKIFAAQKDIKDYEVVKTAIKEYFERNK